MPIQVAQQKINAILAGCNNASSINEELTNQAKHKCDAFVLPKNLDHTLPVPPLPAPTYAKNDDQVAYLLHQ